MMKIRLFGRPEIARAKLERLVRDRIYLKTMSYEELVDEIAAILELAGGKIKREGKWA